MSDKFEKIEQYLNGSMSLGEKQQFESEILLNDDLATDVATYRMIEEAMYEFEKSREGEEALKESLKKISKSFTNTNKEELIIVEAGEKDTKHEQHTKPKKIVSWQKLAVAASVIGVIAVAAILYTQSDMNSPPIAVKSGNPDTEKSKETDTQKNIASQNLSKNENSFTPSSEKNKFLNDSIRETLYAQNFSADAVPADIPESLTAAFISYENDDYQNALIEFSKTNTRGSNTDTLLLQFYTDYYKALCEMNIGQETEAITDLEKAINEAPDSLQMKVRWNLALTCLKTAAPEKMNEQLAIIIAGHQSAYQSKALLLQDELKKINDSKK